MNAQDRKMHEESLRLCARVEGVADVYLLAALKEMTGPGYVGAFGEAGTIERMRDLISLHAEVTAS